MKARTDFSPLCRLCQPPQSGRVLRGVGLRAAAVCGRLLLRPPAGQCAGPQHQSLKSCSTPALRHCLSLHHFDLQVRIPASLHHTSEMMMMTCPALEKITYARRNRYDILFKVWRPFMEPVETLPLLTLRPGPVGSDVTVLATRARCPHHTCAAVLFWSLFFPPLIFFLYLLKSSAFVVSH